MDHLQIYRMTAPENVNFATRKLLKFVVFSIHNNGPRAWRKMAITSLGDVTFVCRASDPTEALVQSNTRMRLAWVCGAVGLKGVA